MRVAETSRRGGKSHDVDDDHDPKLVEADCDFVFVVVDVVRFAAVQIRARWRVEENELALCARRVQMLNDLFATGGEPSSACTRAAHAVSVPRAK